MKRLLIVPMVLVAATAHGAWEETVPAPSGDDTVMINNIASPPGDTSQFTAFKNFPVSLAVQSLIDGLADNVTLVEVEESDLTFTGAIDATNAESVLTGLITLGHSGSDFTNTIAPQSGNYTNNWQTEFGDYPGRVPNATSVGTDGSINGLLTSFTGTFALPQTAVVANTCVSSAAYQDTAAGIVAGDVVNANYNSTVSGKTGYGALATDGLKVNAVAGAGSITFEVCNVTDSSITPDAISVNWQVIK